jgi:hypothetical protein
VCGWNCLHKAFGKLGYPTWHDRAKEKTLNMMQQRFWTLVCKQFRYPMKLD